MKDYHINIFFSDDDDAYVADIPDLRYCSALGETPEAALSAVLEAKQLWFEVAQAEGKPISSPRYRPVLYQIAS